MPCIFILCISKFRTSRRVVTGDHKVTKRDWYATISMRSRKYRYMQVNNTQHHQGREMDTDLVLEMIHYKNGRSVLDSLGKNPSVYGYMRCEYYSTIEYWASLTRQQFITTEGFWAQSNSHEYEHKRCYLFMLSSALLRESRLQTCKAPR